MRSLFIIVAFSALHSVAQERALLQLEHSEIVFHSVAPMESISATNNSATGLIDPDKRTFAIRIPVRAFVGFNSPLQTEHFNENYMVVRKWSVATFNGRMIESFDHRTPGKHTVRAKGQLNIRGVVQERIIQCDLIITDEGIRVMADFDVILEDHGILIPSVVQQKIAPKVNIDVDLSFRRSSK